MSACYTKMHELGAEFMYLLGGPTEEVLGQTEEWEHGSTGRRQAQNNCL